MMPINLDPAPLAGVPAFLSTVNYTFARRVRCLSSKVEGMPILPCPVPMREVFMNRLFLSALLILAVSMIFPGTSSAQTTLVNVNFEEVLQVTVSYDTTQNGNQVLTIFGRDEVSQALVSLSIFGIDRSADSNQDSSLNYCHDYALRVLEHTRLKKPDSNMFLSINGQGETSVDIDLSKFGQFVECSILVTLD